MKIFLSYASEDSVAAEEISLALTGTGHEVFFDRSWLRPGDDFNRRLREAVQLAECMIFLISPESVQSGSYTLTELRLARERWPHPEGRVLPVMFKPTPLDMLPPYLRAVTILSPEGNVAAEVAAALSRWGGLPEPTDPRRARVTVHSAVFVSRPDDPAYFINVTNLSESRDIEITHVWFESEPRVFVFQNDRPLPVRLSPDESWETWLRREMLPLELRDTAYELARVRLSNGRVLASVKNIDVPEQGVVPGGRAIHPAAKRS